MAGPRPLRVAVAQFEASAEIRSNFACIERYARRAKARRAELILMPECCLTGYPPVTGLRLDRRTAVHVEAYRTRVQALARELGLWILFGTARHAQPGWFNSASAVRPDGRLAASYDKLHLVRGRKGDVAHFRPGQRLPTFQVRGIRCALLICLDARFPEPFRYLRAKGVKIVFIPFYVVGKESRWKLPVLEGTLRCRAAENGLFVVASNVSGPDHALISRVCDPNGVSLGAAKLDREGLFVVELNPALCNRTFYAARRTDLFELRAKKPL